MENFQIFGSIEFYATKLGITLTSYITLYAKNKVSFKKYLKYFRPIVGGGWACGAPGVGNLQVSDQDC